MSLLPTLVEVGANLENPLRLVCLHGELTNGKNIVSGTEEKALAKYIAGFGTGSTPALGQAPPCRSYRNLVCLSHLKKTIPDLEACTRKEDVARVQGQIKVFKNAYADLITMTKSAVLRFTNALNEAQKAQVAGEALKKDAAGKRRGRQPAATLAPNVLFVDSADQIAEAIKSINVAQDGKHQNADLDVKLPIIFRLAADTFEKGVLKSAVEAVNKFGEGFKTDAARTDTGRSQKQMATDLQTIVASFFRGLLPEGHVMPVDKLTAVVVPTTVVTSFAVAKGNVSCSAEYSQVASLRCGTA